MEGASDGRCWIQRGRLLPGVRRDGCRRRRRGAHVRVDCARLRASQITLEPCVLASVYVGSCERQGDR